MAKETNENSISINEATTQAKKNSDVKEKMTPYKKTKQTTFIVSFIMILYGFLWILKKNKQNMIYFLVKNRLIDNLYMGKNTKIQVKLT